jgi:ElaB/YqjD/DUF883 family membrane-anchored ribosome-binding protein
MITMNMSDKAASTNSHTDSSARNNSSSSALADAVESASDEITSAAKTEFDNIMSDLQDLVKRAGKLSEQELTAIRQQMTDKLGVAQEKLRHLSENTSNTAQNGIDTTEKMIKEHPLQAIGIAALAGIAIGALLKGRQ